MTKQKMQKFTINNFRGMFPDDNTCLEWAKGVQPLFDTPRHRPEFRDDPKETYYQVMFESPDKVLFEVVYSGLKA